MPAAAAPAPRPSVPAGNEEATPLRGAASRIVANMEASLTVPTATSVRTVPARLLEVNRLILNNQLARTTGAKVSFTHIIGYAVVRALRDVPAMNAAFVADAGGTGKPGVIHHKHVGLGLAVDQEKSDGSRTLLVPCIKEADQLDFRAFVLAYEDLIRKIHTNKIGPDDFAGTTVSLTNPGTLGTVQSVPRLMPGQGAIIGVGALGYPAGFEAADPRVVAQLGLGKVVTLTSTYDHRIIQGAESGLFLARVAALLTGADGFYVDLFESMGVPYEPVRWQVDSNAGAGSEEGEHQRLVKQVHVQTLINMYRVRGHLIAHLDPLDAEPPHIHPELDPMTYGLTIWDLPRQFVADGLAGRDVATLDEILHVLRDAYCRTLAIEYMHIQDPEQKRWIQQHVEGLPTTLEHRRATAHPRSPQRGGGVRALPTHPLRRAEAVRARGRGVDHRPARRAARRRRGLGGGRGRHGHGPPRPSQRAGQHRRQVLPRDLRGVRGQPGSRFRAGLGRREVPQGRPRGVPRQRRRGAPHHAGIQPVAPRGGGPRGRGDDEGEAGQDLPADRRHARRGGRGPGRVPVHVRPRPR